MTRQKMVASTITTLVSILGTARLSLAQLPAPPPAFTTAPTTATTSAPIASPAETATAAVPVAKPARADDMTCKVGFGVGLIPGNDSLVKPDTSVLAVKYWSSDTVAWIPQLKLSFRKVKDEAIAWSAEPSALVAVTLLKGASTRLSAGAGLGFALAKNQAPATALDSSTHFAIFLPVQVGVEHLFTSWFAVGIATEFNLFSFSKQGDRWELSVEVSSREYLGSLFFYTD